MIEDTETVLGFLREAIRAEKQAAERADDTKGVLTALLREKVVALHSPRPDDSCRTCVDAHEQHEPWPCPTALLYLVAYGWRHDGLTDPMMPEPETSES